MSHLAVSGKVEMFCDDEDFWLTNTILEFSQPRRDLQVKTTMAGHVWYMLNALGLRRIQSAFFTSQHIFPDHAAFNLDGKGPAIPYLVKPTPANVGNATMGTRAVFWKK